MRNYFICAVSLSAILFAAVIQADELSDLKKNMDQQQKEIDRLRHDLERLERSGSGGEARLIKDVAQEKDIIPKEILSPEIMENYPFPHKDTQPGGKLTVSVGVAALKVDAKDADGLIKKVDDVLYMAKEGGRNRVVSA